MALRLRIKSVEGFKDRCERFIKATFRGSSYCTTIRDNESQSIKFDEMFQWQIGTNLSSSEVLYLQLFNRNKYLSNKLIGSYGLILQKVAEDNDLEIRDYFTDDNNMITNFKVIFEVSYCCPESRNSMNDWTINCDELNLSDVERQSLYPKSPKKARQISPSRTLPATVRSIANIMKLNRKASKAVDTCEEHTSLTKAGVSEYGSTLTLGSSGDVLVNIEAPNNCTQVSPIISDGSSTQHHLDLVPFSITTPVCVSKLQDRDAIPDSLKPQDFQVCITVVEARHLAGLNMDPVICVQVGDLKKYTSVKESTNCPYYNEYFVFDFHLSPAMLFDKMITLTVLYSRNFIRSGKPIGSFKLDVGTVFAQPDHQFHHKWALLTDPDDIGSGAKGYLKCDLLVAGKGDAIKPQAKNESADDDDIEGNLLLPRGVIAERQHAKYIIKIYRADGLPRNKSGIVDYVKKAIAGDNGRQMVSPYVQVSFAGMSGKTTIKRNCCAPVWNEQVIITEMFPPLCQRIKIQIRDSDPVSDNVIATHFIQLAKISNEGSKGFLPTFGPSFVYLYGSSRDCSIFDDQSMLNDGFSEGIMYRGRILISIKTEILESLEAYLCGVNVEPTSSINENNYGKSDEFLLFASIFESNMIDRKYADRLLHYEITIGNDGYQKDSGNNANSNDEFNYDDKATSDKQLLSFVGQQVNNYDMRSTTSPIRPVMTDRQYYHLPIESDKPCIYLKPQLPDHRRRAYDSNIIEKIVHNLEIGVTDVQEMIRVEKLHSDRRLRGVIEELILGCGRYLTLMKSSSSGTGGGNNGLGTTKLDKERSHTIKSEMTDIINTARQIKVTTNDTNIRDSIKSIQKLLHTLKELTEDPQHSLPDIFVWLLCGNKRIAYQKLQTRQYLFSSVEEECGKLCGKLHNIFLKLPGKKKETLNGIVQNMLYIYVWIGNRKHKKHYPKGLPKGYRLCEELVNADKQNLMPPTMICYEEKHRFQLRAHIYQARSLFASDSSGLSDPFAKVILSDMCQTTEVIEETLSPTWDQMLLFHEIIIYGCRQDVQNNPPVIVIEIYDRDNVGKAEFIGRALARNCYIRFSDQTYQTPQLEWHDVWRGDESAGQLLACFELIQLINSQKTKSNSYPELLPEYKTITNRASPVNDNQAAIYPVPMTIRPTLSKYRIEVLFWGLRDLKRVQFMSVDRPRVDIECAGNILQSSIILNYKKNPNFMIPVKHIDLELPDQEIYCPPLTIRVVDCRSFGRFVLVGTHVIASLSKYTFKDNLNGKDAQFNKTQDVVIDPNVYGFFDFIYPKDVKNQSQKSGKKKPVLAETTSEFTADDDENHLDWWSRYFASVEAMIEENKTEIKSILDLISFKKDVKINNMPNSNHTQDMIKQNELNSNNSSNKSKRKSLSKSSPSPKRAKTPVIDRKILIKIYGHELESQPQFEGFKEYLQSYELYRGKRSGNENDDLSRLCGVFKGSLKLYRHPFSSSIFETRFTPSNEPINVLIRIYIVKGNGLHPADLNGKADPYIVISLGSKRVSDKDNYISKQLNPIFGKCFEFEATFPQDSSCTIQIYDWDLFGSDDLIGETKIDLENRFYSKHRATCGLPKVYHTSGPNQWRDSLKPTQILSKLCKDYKISGLQITKQKIKVGSTTFHFGDTADNILLLPSMAMSEEDMALAVLHNWSNINGELVPEHIETRRLYHPDKPGIEQGKLEMWIDMFPRDTPSPPPPLDISPRKPKSYELRVIIWNTEDVLLEDDAFFTGEKMSDIYVKGWLKGPEDTQCTDIHYRSLTGEGNFNWRFVFPFDYLPAEEKIVISRKESLFSWDETECKIPARLQLQVWDADHFSADDFLGAITLDLNRFPRGAKTAKLCTLDMLKSDNNSNAVPTVSLFKQKRIKGWWPFYGKKDNEEFDLTGKVEAEMQLLTREEADRNPVGLGRSEPDALEKPNRPDSSFIWVLNPLKSIRYIVWHNYKWLIIKSLMFLLLVLLLALFVYSIPGYTVKKMIGA